MCSYLSNVRRRFALFALSGAIAGCGALIGLGDYVIDGTEGADGSVPGDGGATDGASASDAPVVVIPPGCGNHQLDPGEGCDDGNHTPYDGCSPFCQSELLCNGDGCRSTCGDGFRLASEACDDGNTKDGDGCSSTCHVEVGFQCTEEDVPRPTSLIVPVIYRDMRFSNSPHGHPDFESHSGPTEQNLVADRLDTLGPVGRPVMRGAAETLSTPTNFCWWYHEQGCAPDDPDAAVNPFAFTVTKDGSGVPPTIILAADSPSSFFYSNNQFFPLNGLGWDPTEGFQPDGSPGCGLEAGVNFSFTTELHVPFTFHGTEKIEFVGDDDMWVFLNGRLALDVGGIHGPRPAFLALGQTGATTNRCSSDAGPCDIVTASQFGLVAGETYDLAIFQAERHVCGSNFTLRLTDFNRTQSKCTKL